MNVLGSTANAYVQDCDCAKPMLIPAPGMTHFERLSSAKFNLQPANSLWSSSDWNEMQMVVWEFSRRVRIYAKQATHCLRMTVDDGAVSTLKKADTARRTPVWASVDTLWLTTQFSPSQNSSLKEYPLSNCLAGNYVAHTLLVLQAVGSLSLVSSGYNAINNISAHYNSGGLKEHYTSAPLFGSIFRL